jgi:hypothetical protein
VSCSANRGIALRKVSVCSKAAKVFDYGAYQALGLSQYEKFRR